MKKESGITLISLIVTIIVLLILTAISIASVTGENGTIKETKVAISEAELAELKQNVLSAYVQANAEKRRKNQDLSANIKRELEKKYSNVSVTLEQDGKYTIDVDGTAFTIDKSGNVGLNQPTGEEVAIAENGIEILEDSEITNDNLKDKDTIRMVLTGDVPIPDGATYKEGTKSTGVVIEYKGSEFVWVPVPVAISDTEANGTTNKAMALNIGTAQSPEYRGMLYDFFGSGNDVTSSIKSGCTTTTDSYREPDIVTSNDTQTYLKDIGYANDSTAQASFLSDLKADYKEMVESVAKYGGFFVGRYETSIDGTTVASKKSPDATTIMPMTAADNSQMWYGMYKKQKDFSTSGLISSMIWGSQYDAMLNWVITTGTDKAKISQSSNGNHDNSGAVGCGTYNKSGVYDIINNIYDLEGNMREWTLEAVITRDRVFRGEFYGYYVYVPSDRGSNDSILPSVANGSRLSLYIKEKTTDSV